MILLQLYFFIICFLLRCLLDLNMGQIGRDVKYGGLTELLSHCFVVLVAIVPHLIVHKLHLNISMMEFTSPMFILHWWNQNILLLVLLQLFTFRLFVHLFFLPLCLLCLLLLSLPLLLAIIRKKLSWDALLLLLYQYLVEVGDLLFHVFLFLLLFPPFFFRLPFIFQLLQHSFFFFL